MGSIDRSGHSGRRGPGPATGGVRANRVGAKLSVRASVARGAGDPQARADDPLQPLTRDNSASSLRKEPTNRLLRPAPCASKGPGGEAGFIDSQVVLVDRFDCRSRRAARGVVRSRAMSSRKRRGLVLPQRRAKERRKPVVGGKALEPVAGPRSGGRESERPAGTRRGKALRAVKPISFDEGVAEAVLVVTEASASRRRDRERQRFVLPPRARSKTPPRRGAV